MDLMSLISKMITFIALMLVGYIGARRKLLDNAFARALSQLVMNLFLTGTVINSVISERPELTGFRRLVKGTFDRSPDTRPAAAMIAPTRMSLLFSSAFFMRSSFLVCRGCAVVVRFGSIK